MKNKKDIKQTIEPERVDIDEVIREDDQPATDGIYTSSNQGGIYDEDKGETYSQNVDAPQAGEPGSSQIDEGTA